VQVFADDEVMLVTDRGRLIRLRVSDIRIVGRNTQGVSLLDVDDGRAVVSIARVLEADTARPPVATVRRAAGVERRGSAGERSSARSCAAVRRRTRGDRPHRVEPSALVVRRQSSWPCVLRPTMRMSLTRKRIRRPRSVTSMTSSSAEDLHDAHHRAGLLVTSW